ncbi:MAG: DinB family protein [Sumerlaeia bacterium]
MTTHVTTECSQHAQQIRSMTQFLLGAVKDDLTPQQAVFQLPHSKTHILWIVGHITTGLDFMVSILIDRKPLLPESQNMRFFIGSVPSADAADFPSIQEMIGNLVRVTNEVAAHLEAQDDRVLDQLIPEALPFHMLGPTVREFLAKGDFHTGYHTGQVTLLRSAQGLAAGYGV